MVIYKSLKELGILANANSSQSIGKYRLISTPGKLTKLRFSDTCYRSLYSAAANAQAGHGIRVGLLSLFRRKILMCTVPKWVPFRDLFGDLGPFLCLRSPFSLFQT